MCRSLRLGGCDFVSSSLSIKKQSPPSPLLGMPSDADRLLRDRPAGAALPTPPRPVICAFFPDECRVP
jgi:hypothetical protein